MIDDTLFDALRALPEHAPDTRREARVRATCHARIQRRAKRKRIATRVLQGATAAALCVYLVSVLSVALRLPLARRHGKPQLPSAQPHGHAAPATKRVGLSRGLLRRAPTRHWMSRRGASVRPRPVPGSPADDRGTRGCRCRRPGCGTRCSSGR